MFMALVLLALALTVVLALAAVRALAAPGACTNPTISWVGNAGTEPDSWHTASNWDANRVPGAGDNVCISDAANTSTIVFSTGASSVASFESEEALTISGGTLELTSTTEESKVKKLTLSGGTLSGVGNLTIPAGGTATWSGGHMIGTGRTLVSGGGILGPAATLSITGSSDKALREGRVLENEGEAIFSGAYIASGTGAVIENTGVFDIRGDGDVVYNYGGTKAQFENTGTLKKSSGTGSADVSTTLDNDGAVEVGSGTLDLPGGTNSADNSDTSAGDFLAGAGATLRFSGEHRLSGLGSSVSGSGTVAFPSNTSTVAVEDYDVAGTTALSGGTVNFEAPVTSRTLEFSGGVLTGTGTVSVPAGGNATWSGGHMTSAGRTTISGASGGEPAATLSITGSSDKALRGGRVLENAGETVFSGAYVASGTGAAIENTGVFDIRGDGDIVYNYGGTKTRFENTGTLKKTSGTGNSDVSTTLDNDGSVGVSSGTLGLLGGTNDADNSDTSTGDFSAASGATLELGGNHRLSGSGSSVAGAGTIRFSSGTTNVDVESYSVGGTTAVSGANATFTAPITTGTLNVSGGNATLNEQVDTRSLNLSGGTLGGSGVVEVPAGGTATWSGGHMTGTGRTLISGASGSEPAATLSVTGPSDKALREGRVLENAGDVSFSGAYIASGTGAVIENKGTFDIRGDGDVVYNFGGIKTRFENTGTLKKSSGTASSDISTTLDNDGSVEVSSGTLDLPGGSDNASPPDTSTGDFLASAGATLRFSGSHRLSGPGSSIAGSGTVAFPSNTSTVAVEDYDVAGTTALSGGTVNFEAPVTSRTLDLSGGTLSGGGNVTIPSGGTATWSGGHMTGTGKTLISGASGGEPAATLSITGPSDKALRERRVLDNAGEIVFSGAYIASGTGAVIENTGTFDIKGNGDIVYNYGGTKTCFENTGTLKKTSGTGNSDVSTTLDNDGSVGVSSGTLGLLGGTNDADNSDTSAGDFEVGAGSTLRFGGGHRLSGVGSSIAGSGHIDFPGGTANVGVESYSVGETTVSGANATFTAPMASDALDVTGGTAAFNAAASAKRLGLSGGYLDGSGNVTVLAGGTATWSGGHMIGAGRTTISGASGGEPAATFSITGSSDKALRGGRVLENAGETVFSGAYVASGTGAAIENTGVFDIRGDGDIVYNYGGTKTRFENTGRLKRTSGTGTVTISASLENDGSVEARSGALEILGGTDDANPSDVSRGDFALASGTTMTLGGNHRLSGVGSSVKGAGTIVFPHGTANVGTDSYSVSGTTTVSGATVTFGSPVAAETLNVASGAATFNAATTADALNVTGGAVSFNKRAEATTLELSGGILGGDGNLIVPAGGNATWSSGQMTGAGRTLISGPSNAEPAAALSISGSSDKVLREGRVLENSGAVAFSASQLSSGTGAVIVNSGTFDLGGDGDLLYNYGGTRTRFENTGTFKKTFGTASSDIGAAVDNDGGTVEVSSGTLHLTGGLDNFSSAGGVGRLAGGSYLIRNRSALKFSGADIDVNAATIVLDGLGSAILDHNNSDAIDNLSNNDGSLTIGSDRDLTTIGALNNSGSISIGADSVLTTTGDYVQAAGSTQLAQSTSELAASGARVRVQGGVMEGVGTIKPILNVTGGRVKPGISRGILKAAGSYVQGPNGTLEVEIGGAAPGTGHDQLDVGTTASLAGTLDIVTPTNFTPAGGESFTVLKCGTAACRNGQFDTVQGANVGSGLEYQVRYNATNVTLEFVDSRATNTSLTLSATPSSLVSGETTTLTGTLTSASGGEGLSEEQVILRHKPAGADEFSQLGEAVTTDADGNFSFDSVQPSESTEYRARFAGDQTALLNASASNVETVTVTAVNNVPTAKDDIYSTNTDTKLTVTATEGVLKNDTDAEGTTLRATLVDAPGYGVLDLEADGSFVYSPNPGYAGEDAFTYKASDGTSESNAARVSLNIGAGNAPPETSIVSGPASLTKNTSATFSFSSNRVGAVFECKLDNSAFGTCTSPHNYTALATGRHTFSVRAKDQAGNVDATPATRTWMVDTIKPSISGISPKDASTTTDTTPTIKAIVRDNTTQLKKANIRLYVNGNLIPADRYSYSGSTEELTYNSSKLAQGKNTVKIIATDAAGNVGEKPWYFTIK